MKNPIAKKDKTPREIIEDGLIKTDETPVTTEPPPAPEAEVITGEVGPKEPEAAAETKVDPPPAAEVKTEVKTDEPKKERLPMRMDQTTGIVIVETLQDEMNICAGMVAANMVPATLNTPQKLFVARQLCRELGLPATAAIRQVYVVNGVPTLWGDTPLGLVRSKGLLAKIDEYFITKDYVRISVKNKNLHEEVFAAVCEIQRTGDELKEYFFTRQMAIDAGLTTKNGSLYGKYFSRMIQMKARGLALKGEFGDVLNGVAMAEYDFDQMNGARDVTDPKAKTGDTATKANNLFGNNNSDDSHKETSDEE